MNPKFKKQLLTTLKILISGLLIYLVFRQLNWNEIKMLMQKANPFYFVGAVLLFIFSQLVSVFRFNLFIRQVGVRLSFKSNSQLYLLGMFYNFFLPGGVGGDAYKAYALSKSYEKSLKKIGQVVFIERFLGIVAIGFVLSVLIIFMKTPYSYLYNLLVTFLGLIGVGITLRWIIRFLHTYKKRVYLGFLYSIGIQILQLICVFCLLKSFHIDGYYLVYMILFLISSILSVISFAGLGIREAVFFYGGKWFQFNPDASASVALAFSLITAAVSFMGIIYLFQKIQLKKNI